MSSERPRASRREFLAGVAGAVIGLAVGAAAGATAFPRKVKETVTVTETLRETATVTSTVTQPVTVTATQTVTRTIEVKPWLPERWDEVHDIVIVGSGFAGLSAAIEAYDSGVRDIVILEKMPTPGGNSIISGGAYNAVDPKRQKAQGIEDSIDLHFKHTMEGGGYRNDPEKVRYLVEHALEGLEWLEKFGVVVDDRIFTVYGALWPRTHRVTYKGLSGGAAMVQALLDQVEARGIPIRLRHKVTRIIREEQFRGRVLGVEVETADGKRIYIKARRAVILAAGGFAANDEKVALHDRRLAGLGTTNHPGATGEVIDMAVDIGAATVHMDFIQCVVGGWKPEVRGLLLGAFVGDLVTDIWVSVEGKRFIREDATREEILDVMLTLPHKMAIVIDDSRVVRAEVAEATPGWRYGNIVRADTIEELVRKIREQGVPITDDFEKNLKETIRKYNYYVEIGKDEEFGKHPVHLTRKIDTPPFYASFVMPSRHHTMGGLVVKGITGQVIDRWGNVIPKLYAAGEITGGTHGKNRLGGNAIPDCIVFGRLVGRLAAQETPLD